MPRRDDDRFPLWKWWLAAQWVLLAGLILFVVSTLRGQEGGEARAASLTLKQAIDLALAPDGNARAGIAKALVAQASARSGTVRAALLPNVEGAVSQSSQTRNLQALGIQFNLPVPGASVPSFVGPFNVFDARLSVTQTVLSLSGIRRYQASKEGISVAKAEEQNARDQVAAQVARTYFLALRTEAQRDAAKANLELAQELESLAEKQKNAGTGLAVEVTRAMVQRSQAEQALLVRENELRAARLQLRKAIGLDLGTIVELVDHMQTPSGPQPELPVALEMALSGRADWQSQQARAGSARLMSSASKWERLPSVVAFGDYGASGNTPSNSLPTRAIGVSVRVPIFDGGRREAQRAESGAKLREEELRTRDMRQQIELEIRLALDALESSRSQVAVAAEALRQADLELEQATRRYRAGVASSLEITRAQSSFEQARANDIDSLFRYNLARVDYALAVGRVQTEIP